MKRIFDEQSEQAENVVHLELDASFFFERAVRSLDKHQYDKALRYFRLSVEKEPDNPVNYCNLAGLLSELGYYEESNEVLKQVISEVAPDMHECRFYIANNYANLNELEHAEEHLLKYLGDEPSGEYAEDAEELLYMVAADLGRAPRDLELSTMPQHVVEHEEARRLLEAGKFSEAIDHLRPIVEQYPEFLAAQNNLSLAYYYAGDFTQAFAMVEQVLERDATNLHALCNLAIFSDAVAETEKSQTLTQALKKLIPLHPELLYKLATSLGILGEDQSAYRLLDRFMRLEMTLDDSMCHYLAVAAWNVGRYREANRYWRQGLEFENNSQVICFYLELAEQWQGREQELGRLSYYYYLPFQEALIRLSWHKRVKVEMNTVLHESMIWALAHGLQSVRIQVIQMLGWIGGQKSERFLRRFLVQPDNDSELKRIALLVLRQLNTKPPYMIWFQDHLIELNLDEQGEATVSAHFDTWCQVLYQVSESMTTYTARQREDVQWLWAEYVCTHGAKLPKVRRQEAWAAAFEYIVARRYHLQVSRRELAIKYHASLSTMSHHIHELAPLTDIYC